MDLEGLGNPSYEEICVKRNEPHHENAPKKWWGSILDEGPIRQRT